MSQIKKSRKDNTVVAENRSCQFQKVLLIVKLNRLLAIRTVSPEFRLTRTVYTTLIALFFLFTLFFGFSITFLIAVLPKIIELIGPAHLIVPGILYACGVFFLAHHILSISGRSAREVRAPADAAILAHAGYSRSHLIIARIIIPASVETAIMVSALLLYTGIAIYSWGLPVGILTKSLIISLALTTSGAVFRISTLCALAAGSLSPTLLRSVLWSLFAFGSGALFSSIALPLFLGVHELHFSAQETFTLLLTPYASATLITTSTTLFLASAATSLWLRRFPWNDSPIDSFPTRTARRLPLPRKAWGRLLALPLTTLRDHRDTEAGEFLIYLRTSLMVASFGCGTLIGAAPPNPFLSREAAWGLVAATPLLATGLIHGVCSLNAFRPLLPHLTASNLGTRGVASALMCSSLLLCAPLSLAYLPILRFITSQSMGSMLLAWLIGLLLAPGLMLLADCLFPARPPAQSNGRIRQHPLASLTASVLALACGTAAYTGLHVGIPAPVVLMLCILLAALFVVIAQPPRETVS